MKFVLLNGASCSGKSSVITEVLKRKNRLFHLSYDATKWMFSDYAPATHVEDVQTVLVSIADTVCGLGYDIITDSVISRDWRGSLARLAVRHGYEVVEINLEADYETLSRRFDRRVEEASKDPGKKISNLSKERFRQIFETYEREKNPSATAFRTDKKSAESVAAEVAVLL